MVALLSEFVDDIDSFAQAVLGSFTLELSVWNGLQKKQKQCGFSDCLRKTA